MSEIKELMKKLYKSLREAGLSDNMIRNMSFYEIEEELQIGHYKVVSVPIERGGHILLSTSSSDRIKDDYKYIKRKIY